MVEGPLGLWRLVADVTSKQCAREVRPDYGDGPLLKQGVVRGDVVATNARDGHRRHTLGEHGD